MSHAVDFHQLILDTLPQQIALVDSAGGILWVNNAWRQFSADNGGALDSDWSEINYLNVCRESSDRGDSDAEASAAGIEAVIAGDSALFEIEYPCHSPTTQRWFSFNFRPLEMQAAGRYFVASHTNITMRVIAEQKVKHLAISDGMTGLANRRHFDSFLDTEWRRAKRYRASLSLLLIDVDNFKSFNDNYGHLAGDDCLRQIGKVLQNYSRRPSDLVARFGGEEFAILLGDASEPYSLKVADEVHSSILDLNIPHAFSIPEGIVSVSGGIAIAKPSTGQMKSPKDLIAAADRALYAAKDAGRNQFAFSLQPAPSAGGDSATPQEEGARSPLASEVKLRHSRR